MEKGSRLLSLGEWPARVPIPSKTHLSPITKRILGQVQVEVRELLPITYQQFLQQGHRSVHNKQQLEEYREEVERRKKQVAILVEMRTSYILGQEYGNTEKKSSRSNTKMRVKSRINSKEYAGELRLHSRGSKSKMSRNISRMGTERSGKSGRENVLKSSGEQVECSPSMHREDSDYFVNFDPRKNSHRKTSNLKEDDSTKSHQGRKSKIRPGEHSEYGCFGYSGRSKVRGRKDSARGKRLDSSKELCGQLLKTVQAWERLDRQHLKELSHMGSLSVRERERLTKMHSLQKGMMGVRMRGLKSRLRSEGV